MANQKSSYYVYVHRRADNGTVFFVGSGTGDRYKTRSNGAAWKAAVEDAGGFYGEVYLHGLTKNESVSECNALLSVPLDGWNLIPRQLSRTPIALTVESVIDRLVYDESSPSCLRWKRNGRIAGTASGSNYFKVELDGVNLFAHRIVWVLFYGSIAGDVVINHIDCNGKNNKITNLEVVETVNNNRRKKMHVLNATASNNTTGVNGVNLKVTKHGDKHYRSYVARWYDSSTGRRQTKDFAVNIYGEENAKQLACAFMLKKRDELTEMELANA